MRKRNQATFRPSTLPGTFDLKFRERVGILPSCRSVAINPGPPSPTRGKPLNRTTSAGDGEEKLLRRRQVRWHVGNLGQK